MKVTENNNAEQFLLGKLSEESLSLLEREFFESRTAFDELLIAENALIDKYVSDRLSPAERQSFEQRLLITDRQRRRVAFAETLLSYASRDLIEEAGDAPFQSKWRALVTMFRAPSMFSYAAAAATILVVAGAALWWGLSAPARVEYAQHTSENAPAPAEPIAPVALEPTESPATRPLAPPSPATAPDNIDRPEASDKRKTPAPVSERANTPVKSIAALVLPLVTTRDGGPATALIIPRNAKSVNLQLTLGEESFPHYFVVIETVDGQQVWNGKVGSRGKSKGLVTAIVPARLLKTGDYIAILKGSSVGQDFRTIGEYSFVISRK